MVSIFEINFFKSSEKVLAAVMQSKKLKIDKLEQAFNS
jgi:hypothetical protein